MSVAWKSFGGSKVATAVSKATSREIMGPKKKHVDYLITCTSNELMNLSYMSEMLLARCRMPSWVIVSKALVTFHSLMSNGNERFFQQLAARTSLWDLENFLDKTAVTGYDMSSFIKRYSKYLIQKVHSCREMNYDFCRAKRGTDGVLRTLDADKLLKAIAEIQTQIDSLLEVDLQSSEFSNGVINSAFVLLFKDLIKLFACYNDGMINLLGKY
ncbi:clathrin coat assembly AP180 [Paramuricea clavata]|uniref:Clathrin coat assembly AP180, partial n=1 Tax=Paramuricea clavata TaxID=317549 RepID=A0A7D9K6R9_PARCT|nr:clathrin coat assembly AP180 [Paramuricea clavata]